jgi:hypothetical protein
VKNGIKTCIFSAIALGASISIPLERYVAEKKHVKSRLDSEHFKPALIRDPQMRAGDKG